VKANSIVTSHVGTLPRPQRLEELCTRYELPEDQEAFKAAVPAMIAEVVRRQAEVGLAIVNDGEFSKQGGFSYYAQTRLGGLEERPPAAGPPARDITARDAADFPGYYRAARQKAVAAGVARGRARSLNQPVFCVGPLTYVGHDDARFAIDHLLAAARGLSVRPFLSAVAPGTIEHWLWNEHYASDEELLFAIADAMHHEYASIAEAGILLQIDDPDLADGWQMYPAMSLEDYRRYAALRIDALNHALRGIPEEMVRLHVCWGSGHGPHTHDIPLRDIVDLVLRVRAQCYSIEAANGRHEHEWTVWQDVPLPDGKMLMPGVVGHASDVVEHPELVAQRLVRFAKLVGRENLIAGTDCGLGARVGHAEIAWAKLDALVEGARLANNTRQG